MDKAIQKVDSLIEDEPQNPYFYELKGQMLLETGKINDAVKIYKKALTLHPNSSLFKLNLAQGMIENHPTAEEQQQIVDLLNQVIIYNPDSYAWLLLSRAYGMQHNVAGYNYAAAEYSLLMRDIRLAKQQAEQALKSNPTKALKLKIDDLKLRIKDIEKDKK